MRNPRGAQNRARLGQTCEQFKATERTQSAHEDCIIGPKAPERAGKWTLS